MPGSDYKKPKALLTGEGPTIDSAIVGGEGDRAKNTHLPTIDSAIVSDSQNTIFTPVNDSWRDSQDDSQPIVGDSRDSQPKLSPTINQTIALTGKPLSKKEIELVKNTFALTNQNRRKTVELLYGSWTVSRDKWVKEILSGETYQ